MARKLAAAIKDNGGEVSLGRRVVTVKTSGDTVTEIITDHSRIEGEKFIFTTSFPIIANLFEGHADAQWVSSLRRVKYLGNMCLVLRLNQSLSETYWLNVNDPDFRSLE